MQTFLPSPSFSDTAQSLDRQRLGKQRVETLQIANTIAAQYAGLPVKGWANHPAVKMWYPHPRSLLVYQYAICQEWTGRGYKDTCLQKTLNVLGRILDTVDQRIFGRGIPASDIQFALHAEGRHPWWLGDPDLHLSHRSNLLRKDSDWYSQFWPDDPDDLPYVWPV